MQTLPRLFFATGVIFVLIGMGWGIHMSITTDFTMAPAHAHLNLVGFVSMCIFGTYYELVPGAAATKLAMIHYGLSALTVVVMVPGIYLVLTQQGEALAKAGSLLAVLTMLVFLYTIIRNKSV
ncbi:hypothetical protein [Roseibium sp.]|uniref:hypothetical protein n=1 Tax=Roseibium sp. TaxID=1936156 RepID=UPI003D0C1790